MSAFQNAPGTDQVPSIAFLQVTFESRASGYLVKGEVIPCFLPTPVAVAERVLAAAS